MALFPKIQSPCPYKGDLSAIMDGETCRLCRREVFDLTLMSDAERVTFMKSCGGEVCVSYRMPALAAVALAAAIALPTAAGACEEVVLIMGGIHDPQNAQYVQVPDAKTAPALPVVYEPQAQPVSSKAPS